MFGAPLAHEDHPQRALYAALRMQDAMRRHGETLRPKGYPPLLMRVGVNTGEVVLRAIRKDDLHADYVPVVDKNSVSFSTVLSHGSAIAVSLPSRVEDNPMPSYSEWETATSPTISHG